jgi:hypothetical protein
MIIPQITYLMLLSYHWSKGLAGVHFPVLAMSSEMHFQMEQSSGLNWQAYNITSKSK